MTFPTFRRYMSAIVGDENTVARYLAEKVGHTALIAWALACVLLWFAVPLAAHAAVGWTLLPVAVFAALVYNGTGKVFWLLDHPVPSWSHEWRDIAFDSVVGAFVVPWPLVFFAWWALPVGLGVWAAVFWWLVEGRWGSPG